MKKMKIVIAEDDGILAKVIVAELDDAGFDVKHAGDGAIGLDMINKERPDLVLCDVLMPNMDGFTLLGKLKASPVTKSIPVIMLTMLGSDDDIKKGLKMGANDYIVKSQHAVAEIVEKVQQFFAKESHPEAQVGASKPNMTQEAAAMASQSQPVQPNPAPPSPVPSASVPPPPASEQSASTINSGQGASPPPPPVAPLKSPSLPEVEVPSAPSPQPTPPPVVPPPNAGQTPPAV